MSHQSADRAVATASYDQITRSIYRDSVARWRRYQAHVGELLQVLPDAVDGANLPR